MQLAVRDIGQVTDIQGDVGTRKPTVLRTRRPLLPTQADMPAPLRQARRSLPSHQQYELCLPCRQSDPSLGPAAV